LEFRSDEPRLKVCKGFNYMARLGKVIATLVLVKKEPGCDDCEGFFFELGSPFIERVAI
jgi:hypothetical protein